MSKLKESRSRSNVDARPTLRSNEDVTEGEIVVVTSGSQSLHRVLRGKEVQLFAIGGAIGTCMCF